MLKKENEKPGKRSFHSKVPLACYLGVDADDLDAFHSKLVALGARCIRSPVDHASVSMSVFYSSRSESSVTIFVMQPSLIVMCSESII